MLKPKVPAKEFEKYGFKKCKVPYDVCYYLCISRGMKMLLVSDEYFSINNWNGDDPRIHKRPNCRYKDNRDSLDVVYELIKADMLKGEFE